jgi:hypothetical protein
MHGAVPADGPRQFSTGLLPSSCRRIPGAEATVAVGLEQAHAEFLGQGLLVVGFGLGDIWGMALSRLAEPRIGRRGLTRSAHTGGQSGQ